MSGVGRSSRVGRPLNSMEVLFSKPLSICSRPAIFLDRDGVINEKIAGGYVTQWRQFRFLPGILDALKELSCLGIPVIVVSNQAGVGKGLFPASMLESITRQFVECVQAHRGRIDAVYYCIHTSEQHCGCRKPEPGLLLRSATRWQIDLRRSVLVGDSISDIQAAEVVGCRAILAGSPQDTIGTRSQSIHACNAREIVSAVTQALNFTPAAVTH